MTASLVPLKHIAAINERKLGEDTHPGTEFKYIDIGSVGQGTLSSKPEVVTFETAPSRARRLVADGDCIVSTVRTYLRAVWPVSGPTEDLVVSTGFAVLSPRSVDPGYFSWWVRSGPFTEELVARSTGVSYPAINPAELGEQKVRVPVLTEQRAIADYLDTETARIDALITKKRRLIELLDERWEELSRERILAGLDCVTGAGNPPGGSDVLNLGVLIELQRGHDLPSEARVDGSVPIVSSGGVSGYHNQAAATGPGVVTGRYGTIGEVYYVAQDYWPLNTTLYVKDFRGCDPHWVRHLLSSIPLDAEKDKSAVTGINRNVVGQLRVLRPDLAEQCRVARELDRAHDLHVDLIELAQTQIELLVEHRQALITAAVTGEFAVPGAAA